MSNCIDILNSDIEEEQKCVLIETKLNEIHDLEEKKRVVLQLHNEIEKYYKNTNRPKLIIFIAKIINDNYLDCINVPSYYCHICGCGCNGNENMKITLIIYYLIAKEIKIVKLLFDNGLYNINNTNELYGIIFFKYINRDMYYENNDIKKLIDDLEDKALLKGYDLQKYIDTYDICYELLKRNFHKIENRISITSPFILDIACHRGDSEIALKVLEDTEQQICVIKHENNMDLKKDRFNFYNDEIIYNNAKNNNMHRVINKMKYLRDKYN